MKFLYKHKKNTPFDYETKSFGEVKVFVPRIQKLTITGEESSFKTMLSRLMFQIISRGRAKIYYLSDGEELKHTSYVIPKCYKFPFLKECDYEIGPCYTYPNHRGKGIYPDMLRWICDSIGDDDTTFYMIVDEKNIPSIKGIEKAGFEKCGVVKVSKFTKRYYRVQ